MKIKNIIKYSNQIKDVNNLEEFNVLNMNIKLENYFLSTLLNIKTKMERQIKDNREDLELVNPINSKTKSIKLTKKDKSKIKK